MLLSVLTQCKHTIGYATRIGQKLKQKQDPFDRSVWVAGRVKCRQRLVAYHRIIAHTACKVGTEIETQSRCKSYGALLRIFTPMICFLQHKLHDLVVNEYAHMWRPNVTLVLSQHSHSATSTLRFLRSMRKHNCATKAPDPNSKKW